MFHDLKTLLLDRCDLGVSYQALTSILRNAPNLENVGMHFCKVCVLNCIFHWSCARFSPFLIFPLTCMRPYTTKFLERPKRRRGKAQLKSKPSKRRNSTLLEYKNLKVVELKHERNSTDHLKNIILEISKGMPKEMPLTRWQRVEKLSNTGPMTIVRVRLFRRKRAKWTWIKLMKDRRNRRLSNKSRD